MPGRPVRRRLGPDGASVRLGAGAVVLSGRTSPAARATRDAAMIAPQEQTEPRRTGSGRAAIHASRASNVCAGVEHQLDPALSPRQLRSEADFGASQTRSVTKKRAHMKMLCCIVATAGLFVSAPAMAQQYYSGGGSTNIWSSAQGTSNSYGSANAFGTSSSGSMATAGGQGLAAAAGSAVAARRPPSRHQMPGPVHPAAATRKLKHRATPAATFPDTAPAVIEREKWPWSNPPRPPSFPTHYY